MKAAYNSQVVLGMPVLDSVIAFYGKIWGAVAGFTCAFGCIAYEVGNFTGSGLGVSLLFPVSWKVGGVIVSVVCIILIFSKDVYRRVEKGMKLCVLAMIVSFLISLIMSGGPSVTGIASGFVPKFPDQNAIFATLSFIGSCAAISGVVYGTHLSKEKKWKMADLKNGVITWDVILGVGAIACIVFLVMFTGAKVLHPQGIMIENVQELAAALEPVMGTAAHYLMGLALLAAAVSSLLVSAQMGSTLLLAGFGQESDMAASRTRWISVAIIVLGMGVGLFLGSSPILVLMTAQVCAVINAPLLAILIILIVNRKEMGENRASKLHTTCLIVACLGLILITLYNLAKLLGWL